MKTNTPKLAVFMEWCCFQSHLNFGTHTKKIYLFIYIYEHYCKHRINLTVFYFNRNYLYRKSYFECVPCENKIWTCWTPLTKFIEWNFIGFFWLFLLNILHSYMKNICSAERNAKCCLGFSLKQMASAWPIKYKTWKIFQIIILKY